MRHGSWEWKGIDGLGSRAPRAARFGALAALGSALLACGGLATDPTEEVRVPLGSTVYAATESFEDGFGGWTLGRLGATGVRDGARASDGTYSVRAEAPDGGAVWLKRSFPIHPPKKDRYRATLAFRVWSASTSGAAGVPVLAYLGFDEPADAGDFTIVGRTGSVQGWRRYSLSRTITFDGERELSAALGFGGSVQTHFIDEVTLTVE